MPEKEGCHSCSIDLAKAYASGFVSNASRSSPIDPYSPKTTTIQQPVCALPKSRALGESGYAYTTPLYFPFILFGFVQPPKASIPKCPIRKALPPTTTCRHARYTKPSRCTAASSMLYGMKIPPLTAFQRIERVVLRREPRTDASSSCPYPSCWCLQSTEPGPRSRPS